KAGWLFRDEMGSYKGAGQALGLPTSCVLESELQALILVMQHTWETVFNFGSYNWIRDVHYWQNRFTAVVFKWTPRTTNHHADVLARLNIPNNSSFQFYNYVPLFLEESYFIV
ncbi:PREDICTED: uncharacterized protein LOC109129112, partial [Camelina sativa]|uniref:Uncharacterized protein LOC109129112 n=1 Tax=Camelina sativa TaxID=90675 RepID=A0ABM1QZV0_CAMSA